jgi:hypothetical protein
MANDYVRPNAPALERIVNETTKGEAYGDYAAMKDQLRAALSMPNPNTAESMPPSNAAAIAAVEPVRSTGTHVRVFYPSGNSRFEIYSDSEEGLDSQEARIRALFQ